MSYTVICLDELWMRAGIGDTTRYIPLHIIADRIGALSSVLPAVHALTGSDITSKFGTKADPTLYLKDFGVNPNDQHLERILNRA